MRSGSPNGANHAPTKPGAGLTVYQSSERRTQIPARGRSGQPGDRSNVHNAPQQRAIAIRLIRGEAWGRFRKTSPDDHGVTGCGSPHRLPKARLIIRFSAIQDVRKREAVKRVRGTGRQPRSCIAQDKFNVGGRSCGLLDGFAQQERPRVGIRGVLMARESSFQPFPKHCAEF